MIYRRTLMDAGTHFRGQSHSTLQLHLSSHLRLRYHVYLLRRSRFHSPVQEAEVPVAASEIERPVLDTTPPTTVDPDPAEEPGVSGNPHNDIFSTELPGPVGESVPTVIST